MFLIRLPLPITRCVNQRLTSALDRIVSFNDLCNRFIHSHWPLPMGEGEKSSALSMTSFYFLCVSAPLREDDFI
jgi:hypothetical protein